ncbi:hypothetical protein ACFE04_024697 [Oxalis oulophora]
MVIMGIESKKLKLKVLVEQEELKWKQRSKLFWLQNGDLNSRYFHSHASARKRNNSIDGLRAIDGSWVKDRAGMASMVADYFSKIFSDSDCDVDVCEFARGCWELWESGSLITNQPFHDTLMDVGSRSHVTCTEEFCCISWGIWAARNTMTWKDKNQSPQQVYQHSIRVLRSWKEAMALKDLVRPVGQGSITLQASESTLGPEWICSVNNHKLAMPMDKRPTPKYEDEDAKNHI